jgi:hypothetical protein
VKKQGYIIETRSVIGVESAAMGPWKERQGKEKKVLKAYKARCLRKDGG